MDKRTDILGVGFDSLTMDEAAERAMQYIAAHGEKGGAAYVVTPNPEIVWNCRKDEILREAVSEASMVLADGVGVIYGGKILGTPLKARLPGIDFAGRVMLELSKKGGSVYLLGSKPGVAEKAGEKLTQTYPGLVVAGTHDGYFKDDEPIIREINEKRPDLVLVCLGSPKQERWASANRKKLDAGILACLGGALDVYAGEVLRAPKWMQKAGLEWLYRLIKQPSRIGRMMSLPRFMFAVIWRKLKGTA